MSSYTSENSSQINPNPMLSFLPSTWAGFFYLNSEHRPGNMAERVNPTVSLVPLIVGCLETECNAWSRVNLGCNSNGFLHNPSLVTHARSLVLKSHNKQMVHCSHTLWELEGYSKVYAYLFIDSPFSTRMEEKKGHEA